MYTTSKLHAARINLKHLAQHLGYRSTTWFLAGSGRGLQKIFAGAQARPTLRTPLHEILDPPLLCVKFAKLKTRKNLALCGGKKHLANYVENKSQRYFNGA